MIEIKCTAAEKERLTEVLDTKELPCPFIGLCTELPYYKTGMTHRECIEHNIKWTIADAKPEEKRVSPLSREATITEAQFMEIAANAAVDYYKPHEHGENIGEFIMSTGYMVIVASRLFKEEK